MANKTEKTTEKMVEVRIPLERGRANKDVYVAVNGKSYQIKRGVSVKVPESVAEVLKHAEKQAFKTMGYQESLASN